MRKITLLFLALITSMTLMAQTTLKGKVLDATLGEPLIGATIMVKGTSAGCVADFDGNFTLNVPKGKTHVVVSSVGYQSQTINVSGRNNITVKLKEDSKMMDEVVVVGYGQMKKSDLSGALSQLKGEDMMKGGSIDIAHGMQGKIAGVNIQQSDGAPGGGMSIVVRGTNSFSTSSQPLFIVDGVPFESGSTPSNGATTNEQQSNPLSFINPHDIESIEVLKDASATAIYGSRGANGVVLIQTKKGKAGKPKVEFNATWGWQNISKKIDMLDPVTYATYINEQNLNDRYYNGSKSNTLPYPGTWGYQYYTDGQPNYNTGKYTGAPEDYRNGGWFYDEYGNATQLGTADWQDEIFQNAFQQDYNINVSGGDDQIGRAHV